MSSPKEQLTAQKYDLQFGTNVIGKCLSPLGPADHLTGLSTYRSLAIHTTAVTCSVRSYRYITLPRESAHRDGVIVRWLLRNGH